MDVCSCVGPDTGSCSPFCGRLLQWLSTIYLLFCNHVYWQTFLRCSHHEFCIVLYCAHTGDFWGFFFNKEYLILRYLTLSLTLWWCWMLSDLHYYSDFRLHYWATLLLVHWPPLSFACSSLVVQVWLNLIYSIFGQLINFSTVYVTQTLLLAGTQFEISIKEIHCDTLWWLKLKDVCFSISLNHLDSLTASFTTLRKKRRKAP